tara:strand:+ start:304 stop:1059 length:756 start_codon:yes stop_codon:yes gene_type:complete
MIRKNWSDHLIFTLTCESVSSYIWMRKLENIIFVAAKSIYGGRALGDDSMKRAALFATALAVQASIGMAQSETSPVQASFIFDGNRIKIMANSKDADLYASRFASIPASCDPHCIAPQVAAVGIDTVIEPEVLEFLEQTVGGNQGLLVDARMPVDREMGYIPGSVSLPHVTMAEAGDIRGQIMLALGAREFDGVYNFADAQALMVFDNGPSQNDAGELIANLLEIGYPPEKIKYYRGGMQVWSVLALTIQK